MRELNIAVIKGDGIGPEIVNEAIKVLNKVSEKYDVKFNFTDVLMGGIAIDKTGEPLPKETIDICKKSDSVILGAVGGPKWDTLPGHLRPEKGLLGIRSALGLYANLRPAVMYNVLKDACPLKNEIAEKGIDIMIVRELIGGIYFGDRAIVDDNGIKAAYDTEKYNVKEVERIGRLAFELAKKRNKRVISIDKANVLESSRLWREVIHSISKDYPDVSCEDMLVDNAAMQIVKNPSQFDVVVTSNMFGDILSDEASMVTGSIGLLPSASIGEGTMGLYEPIHGSAPDIAGQNIANPIATILSVSMMLKYSFDMMEESKAIDDAVSKALDMGYRTKDIYKDDKDKLVSTSEMGDIISSLI